MYLTIALLHFAYTDVSRSQIQHMVIAHVHYDIH